MTELFDKKYKIQQDDKSLAENVPFIVLVLVCWGIGIALLGPGIKAFEASFAIFCVASLAGWVRKMSNR